MFYILSSFFFTSILYLFFSCKKLDDNEDDKDENDFAK